MATKDGDKIGSSTSSKPASPERKGTLQYVQTFKMSKDMKSFAKKYRTEISASSSSVLSTFVAYPLDFTKSRLQTFGGSFTHVVTDAYKTEGFRAFWRGVTPPMISITFVRTLSFSIYQRAKYSCDRTIKSLTGKSPLEMANARHSFPNIYTLACFGTAGALSGALITTFACPFELTKLNEQLAGKMYREAQAAAEAAKSSAAEAVKSSASESAKSKAVAQVKTHIPQANSKAGSMYTARRLIRDRGIAGLYSGYRLHLLRDTIGTAIYFSTYESAKQLLANARGKEPTSPYAVVMAGGLCGIASWVCIYPIDVAKTMYQKALLSADAKTAVRPKIKYFEPGNYKGLGVSVVRSALVNALFFSNFELMKKRINALDLEEDD